MVFYFRTRRAYDELIEMLGRTPSPIWVDMDVLTEQELSELRTTGVDVTRFTVDAGSEPNVEIIQLHHPEEVVWVQF